MTSLHTSFQTSTTNIQCLLRTEQRLVTGVFSPFLALIAGLLISVMLLMSSPVHAKPSTEDTTTIEYLIEYVSQSDMTFVRNFGDHKPQRAAKHIRDKYEHFFDDIDSPETFIELCATKSLITGRDYTVIDPQGHKIKTSDWLLDALKTYRKQDNP